ncbi:MAG TPA: hypothetical protein VMY06_14085 [Sedimentisphaerales bacterium]|nr:hypothetical protein [Sedimentisphaerales bacterium]
MRPSKNIEKLIKDVNIDTNAKMDNAVLVDVLEALENSKKKGPAIAQPSIWGIIMKSRITKITTAAVIIIVVMVGLYHYTGSFHGTTAAFATSDVITAMKQVQWTHATTQWIDHNNVPVDKLKNWDGLEFWQSIDPYRTISIGLSGDIEFTELNSEKVYDPKNNTITITSPHYPEKDPPASMQEIWLDCVSDLEKSGAKVEYSDSVYGDRPAKIIKVDYTKESGWHEEITIIVDAETHLAREFMVYQKTTKGESGTMLMLIDYPPTGPKDIYEAGAPHDAEVKVIDNLDEGK